ncbi:MAG: hypothetical protein ACXQS8_00075 [Candidatus Helarchaeales archaeon]
MKVIPARNLSIITPKIQILMKKTRKKDTFKIDVEALRWCSHECKDCGLLKLCLLLDLNEILSLP